MNQEEKLTSVINWKRQVYVLGAAIGAFLGFLSAYLFAKEASDQTEEEERPDVPPTVLLGLALSIISLVRQIAESANKSKKK